VAGGRSAWRRKGPLDRQGGCVMELNVNSGIGILLVILIVLGIIYFAKRV
jgi:hypothetical protein